MVAATQNDTTCAKSSFHDGCDDAADLILFQKNVIVQHRKVTAASFNRQSVTTPAPQPPSPISTFKDVSWFEVRHKIFNGTAQTAESIGVVVLLVLGLTFLSSGTEKVKGVVACALYLCLSLMLDISIKASTFGSASEGHHAYEPAVLILMVEIGKLIISLALVAVCSWQSNSVPQLPT